MTGECYVIVKSHESKHYYVVDIEDNELAVRRHCYELVNGKPGNEEERATDKTVLECTEVVEVTALTRLVGNFLTSMV